MMFNWNDYPAELSARVKEMSKLAPNAVAGFFALDKECKQVYPSRRQDP
jgi:hypothetical protein